MLMLYRFVPLIYHTTQKSQGVCGEILEVLCIHLDKYEGLRFLDEFYDVQHMLSFDNWKVGGNL